MEHPIFLSTRFAALPAAAGTAYDARSLTPGPTCQAAECAGSLGETARSPIHQTKGGILMAKKAAKGAKKKAAKKK